MSSPVNIDRGIRVRFLMPAGKINRSIGVVSDESSVACNNRILASCTLSSKLELIRIKLRKNKKVIFENSQVDLEV